MDLDADGGPQEPLFRALTPVQDLLPSPDLTLCQDSNTPSLLLLDASDLARELQLPDDLPHMILA